MFWYLVLKQVANNKIPAGEHPKRTLLWMKGWVNKEGTYTEEVQAITNKIVCTILIAYTFRCTK